MTVQFNQLSWYLYNGALVPDCPPHTPIELSRGQAGYLLRKSKAYFLRWSSDFDCGIETEWWYLVRDKSIELAEFNSKKRLEIEKGLKNCIVKIVDASFIARHGYEVYKSAFASYDTFEKPAGKRKFHDGMMSKKGNPIFDFWAAFNKADGQIIGYFINRITTDCCLFSAAKFKTEFLKLGVHQALLYEMTNYYLGQLGLQYVYSGARALNHKTNVQEFLINKLHFRKAFCRLNIVYSPFVKIIVYVLYPFRNVISKKNTKIFNQLTVLLRHENIRRSFK